MDSEKVYDRRFGSHPERVPEQRTGGGAIVFCIPIGNYSSKWNMDSEKVSVSTACPLKREGIVMTEMSAYRRSTAGGQESRHWKPCMALRTGSKADDTRNHSSKWDMDSEKVSFMGAGIYCRKTARLRCVGWRDPSSRIEGSGI